MMLALSVFVILLTEGRTSNLDSRDPEDNQLVTNGTFNGTLNLSDDFNTTEFNYSNRHTTTLSPDNEMLEMTLEHIDEKTEETEHTYECSYQSVLEKLDLKKNHDKYVLSRPVKDYRTKTLVYINMRIYTILDVREADQMFISYVLVHLRWYNEHINWNPRQFCGLKHILIPTKYLWMPDLTIEEMTEQDKATPSSHLKIKHHGAIEFRNDQVVVSTCKMEVYRFPFDIQSCNISFKSIMHSDDELMLVEFTKNSELTEQSRQTIQTQHEWIFINMSERKKTINYFGFNQTVVVYTITMKRRSVLYIANFLLPVLFFLCLDFASFLLSDTGGEKVGFKITVLLAVTVMQLILNDILPPSSDKIPLIAIYCIGIFTLMLLSLLETILVMYLIGKDQKSTDKTEENQKLNENPEDKRSPLVGCFKGIRKLITSGSAEDTSKEDQSFPEEGGSSPHTEVSLVMEKVYEELGEMRKSITLLSSRTEDEKSSYWTRVAEKINKIFILFYIIAVLLFLGVLFTVWNIDNN
ncbi:5-hydroxytryptamine receptor 3A-like [Oryzias melastigma]|uniref:5-hydroxytryptamine receptor 3A-like n=1 Tax=Oryzias melastigma TaxID=30732 RepID=UPI00168CFD10|nr:5-hydroxytryptamine receptor 3A-like [Oryzias melastigma]